MIRPGQRVLIIGAGGRVGTFAVQMAKACGAEVTTVDRGDKREMLHATGADRFLDYRREDVASQGRQHDLIEELPEAFRYFGAGNAGGRSSFRWPGSAWQAGTRR